MYMPGCRSDASANSADECSHAADTRLLSRHRTMLLRTHHLALKADPTRKQEGATDMAEKGNEGADMEETGGMKTGMGADSTDTADDMDTDDTDTGGTDTGGMNTDGMEGNR
jgi:hypothetical protein